MDNLAELDVDQIIKGKGLQSPLHRLHRLPLICSVDLLQTSGLALQLSQQRLDQHVSSHAPSIRLFRMWAYISCS